MEHSSENLVVDVMEHAIFMTMIDREMDRYIEREREFYFNKYVLSYLDIFIVYTKYHFTVK